jgi:putative membrane protein
LIRNSVVNGRDWLNLFVVSICLAFSALYELFEWGVAVATGDSAESFLGTQGYIWDTQSDMAMALVGAVLSDDLESAARQAVTKFCFQRDVAV